MTHTDALRAPSYWQPAWLESLKQWATQKHDLLSARMAAGGFHAQDARDMTELSRLLSLLSEHGGGGEAVAIAIIDHRSKSHNWPLDTLPNGTALYTTPPTPSAPVPFDVETMLRACVPGGSSCDPQAIADSIREYVTAIPSAPVVDDANYRAGYAQGVEDSRKAECECCRTKPAALSGVSAPVGVEAVDALRWYAEQAGLCRRLGREGDAGRQALDADGGKRARVAIAALNPQREEYGLAAGFAYLKAEGEIYDVRDVEPEIRGEFTPCNADGSTEAPAAAPRVEELDRQDLAKLLVASCVDLNAEQAEIALHDITDAGKEIGNWIVSVRRQDTTPAASEDGVESVAQQLVGIAYLMRRFPEGYGRMVADADKLDAAANLIRRLASGQVPEGMVLVPREPTPGLLVSMAIRSDHGLGVPGYYDQPLFAESGVSHAQRLEAAIREMRQLHEEVVGTGFYRPEREADYASKAAALAGKERA